MTPEALSDRLRSAAHPDASVALEETVRLARVENRHGRRTGRRLGGAVASVALLLTGGAIAYGSLNGSAPRVGGVFDVATECSPRFAAAWAEAGQPSGSRFCGTVKTLDRTISVNRSVREGYTRILLNLLRERVDAKPRAVAKLSTRLEALGGPYVSEHNGGWSESFCKIDFYAADSERCLLAALPLPLDPLIRPDEP